MFDCEVLDWGEYDGGSEVWSHVAAGEGQLLQRAQGLEQSLDFVRDKCGPGVIRNMASARVLNVGQSGDPG